MQDPPGCSQLFIAAVADLPLKPEFVLQFQNCILHRFYFIVLLCLYIKGKCKHALKAWTLICLTLTHFLGSRPLCVLCSLCRCRDAVLPPAPGSWFCGSAVQPDTSWWFAATVIRPSRGLTAMDAAQAVEADPSSRLENFNHVRSVHFYRWMKSALLLRLLSDYHL